MNDKNLVSLEVTPNLALFFNYSNHISHAFKSLTPSEYQLRHYQ
ncbi:MAG: hypothetical protein ACI89T_001928 [Cognaticolwellia sp.]|jgi:hypothetical protein